MEIRIGIADSPQVVEIELDHQVDRSEVVSQVEAALKGGEEVLRFVDKKGRDWMVPAQRIAYVEVGSADADRRIGFGA